MRWMSAMTLGSLVLSGGLAVAQQSNTDQSERRQPAANERQAGERDGVRREGRRDRNQQDAMFATCLAIDNEAEVAVAEFAARRLTNDQAKQFAQQMVREHRALLEKLARFGAQEFRLHTAAPTSDAVPTGQHETGPQAGEQRPVERRDLRIERREGDEVDFLTIKREIAEQCVQSAQELVAQPADEIDRVYMTAQVFAHQHMLDGLKVLERHVSPQMKETLAQTSQATQQHLQHAKEILESLEGQHVPNASPTSGAANR